MPTGFGTDPPAAEAVLLLLLPPPLPPPPPPLLLLLLLLLLLPAAAATGAGARTRIGSGEPGARRSGDPPSFEGVLRRRTARAPPRLGTLRGEETIAGDCGAVFAVRNTSGERWETLDMARKSGCGIASLRFSLHLYSKLVPFLTGDGWGRSFIQPRCVPWALYSTYYYELNPIHSA
jgi:hypothetical protein